MTSQCHFVKVTAEGEGEEEKKKRKKSTIKKRGRDFKVY